MNNEPVAWMDNKGCFYHNDDYEVCKKHNIADDLIPLYTHPVKEQGNPVAWRSQDPDGYWSVYQATVEGAEPLYTGFKELTDEEMISIYEKDWSGIKCGLGRAVEQAILRKASEK